jgi:hypothetical protein
MLWLYNNTLNNTNNNSFDFYQIFPENILVYSDNDENAIYSFESTDKKLNFDFDSDSNDNYDSIDCEIKTIDNIISYRILSKNKIKSNENYVYITKLNFIKPNNNQYTVPIFTHNYKPTSIKRLPNLNDSGYKFISVLNFKIYNLDKTNQTQFIVETNPLTNSTRKYFITSNLNNLKDFF